MEQRPKKLREFVHEVMRRILNGYSSLLVIPEELGLIHVGTSCIGDPEVFFGFPLTA